MRDITLHSVLRNAERQLAAATIESPTFNARLLIGHALGLQPAAMLGQLDRSLTDAEMQTIDSLVARRLAHEPLARITGETEFWSLPFGINEATLEPRSDSETLVDVALRTLRAKGQVQSPSPWGGVRGGVQDVQGNPNLEGKQTPRPPSVQAGMTSLEGNRARCMRSEPASGREALTSPRILDLGTGTGCLLLSLLHELPAATGIGIDAAPRAVEQATKNAAQLQLSSRATFKLGNWFDRISETFDVIISNPPYIASAEIPTLMPEVREHDPHLALDGGDDGLGIYRKLIPEVPPHLNAGGFVIFEVGQGQADTVAELCRAAGMHNISKHKDLHGIERCVMARSA